MSTPLLGSIMLFAGNFAPRGWALCQGQIIGIAQNTALFSILGTTYGGNGSTTFALPDLRGRVPIGQGQGPGLNNFTLGQQAGVETVTLNLNTLPSHTHVPALGTLAATANVKNGAGNAQSPVGNVPAAEAAGVTATYSSLPPDAQMKTGATPAISLSGLPTIGITGGSQPFDIHTPYLTINYCIALVGIFPSRN